jgi:hypothetical protein
MFKKLASLVLAVVLLINIYGCAAVLVGTAGGAGTAFWLNGKLGDTVNAPISRAVKATTHALGAFKYSVTKTVVKEKVAQIMAKHSDERTIWIDIRYISEQASQIEVRVGARGDKEASQKILNKIISYL